MIAFALYRLWTSPAVVTHFPARACISDSSLGCAISDGSNTATLAESVAGSAGVADEGLLCP